MGIRGKNIVDIIYGLPQKPAFVFAAVGGVCNANSLPPQFPKMNATPAWKCLLHYAFMEHVQEYSIQRGDRTLVRL